MTKKELIEEMSDFPDDMPVKMEWPEDEEAGIYDNDCHVNIDKVTEICPTPGEGANENYLLIS